MSALGQPNLPEEWRLTLGLRSGSIDQVRTALSVVHGLSLTIERRRAVCYVATEEAARSIISLTRQCDIGGFRIDRWHEATLLWERVAGEGHEPNPKTGRLQDMSRSELVRIGLYAAAFIVVLILLRLVLGHSADLPAGA